MVAIIDYGVGNLFSLRSSFAAIGQEAEVTSDPDALRRAERIILPGVGAFGDAAEKLRKSGLDQAVREAAAQGKPLMGICLGMQLLFERSHEFGCHEGLGLIPGEVVSMAGRRTSGAGPAEGGDPPHRGADPGGAEDSADGMERAEDCAESTDPEIHGGGGIRLLCPLLQRGEMRGLPAGGNGVRSGTDRLRRKGQCNRMPVSSGKEREGWAENPEGLL